MLLVVSFYNCCTCLVIHGRIRYELVQHVVSTFGKIAVCEKVLPGIARVKAR
jgi:hypothetical protein